MMSDILMVRLNADLQSKSASYYTIAEKTVKNGKKIGVFATLERFFYKLDFLLKYGHLPSEKDVWGGSLPPELQGLKDFLLVTTNKKNGDSYILQRNEKERYRFSWSNNKFFVSKEEFSPVSPAGARTGYNCTGGWHVSMLPQEAKVETLLHMITQSNAWPAEEFKKIFGSSTFNLSTKTGSFLPPSSNNSPPLTLKTGAVNDFIQDYQKRITEIADKTPNYFVSWRGDVSSAFNTCAVDLPRSLSGAFSFSGIKIPHNLLEAIVRRIMPDYGEGEQKKMTVFNTEPFTANEVRDFIAFATDIEDNASLELIGNTLRHPQFPLAFLAVTSQGICAGAANEPVLMHSSCLNDYFADKGCKPPSLIHEYSITPLDKGEGLRCEGIVYQPCRIDNSTGEIGIGVSRSCNSFCMPESFRGQKEHNEVDVNTQLAQLTSTITTAITI